MTRGKLAAIAELLAVENALAELSEHFMRLAARNQKWAARMRREIGEKELLPEHLARTSAIRFESNSDALLIAAQTAQRRAESTKRRRRSLQRALDS